MEELLKEFHSWDQENSAFYHELAHHESVLYDRFRPVYEVLRHIYTEITEKRLEASDDLDKIFSVGMEYIHDQFQTCKLYLDTYFANDFHQFLEYDKIVSALLYLEDVRYELDEKKLKVNEAEIEMLVEELELMLEEKRPVPETFTLYVDDVLQQALKDVSFQFVGIIDIFVDVAEALGLYLDEEDEILIGKEIEGENQ